MIVVGAAAGGLVVGIIIAVIIYFSFLRNGEKTEPGECPKPKECPKSGECPECPKPKEGPRRPQRPQSAQCPKCPDCGSNDTILGFSITRGGSIVEEIDNVENRLSPLLHKMVCGLLHDPELEKKMKNSWNGEMDCENWKTLFRREIDERFINELKSLPKPSASDPGFARYIFDNNMHTIVADGLAPIRDKIIEEICPNGRDKMTSQQIIDLFKKVRKNFCAKVTPLPNIKLDGFFIA